MRTEWKVAPADAQRFLAERCGAGELSPLRQGLWSSAYGFRVGGDELVARFSSVREDFDKDAFVGERAPAELLVPRIVEMGEALGGWYAISRRLPGTHLDGVDGAAVARALPSLFATLDQVRAIDLSGTTGYGLWDAEGRGRRSTWRDALFHVDRTDPGWAQPTARADVARRAFDAGMARLRDFAPHCPEERHLVHSDLLHWNVLIEGDRVSGLLDWGSSIIGDFVYDLAWLTFWWPWYPQWSELDIVAAVTAHLDRLGVPDIPQRLRCYELSIGLDNLNWYLSRGDDLNLERSAARIQELAR